MCIRDSAGSSALTHPSTYGLTGPEGLLHLDLCLLGSRRALDDPQCRNKLLLGGVRKPRDEQLERAADGLK
eukprot:13015070-Alexandrium_andersonii.AAC.1